MIAWLVGACTSPSVLDLDTVWRAPVPGHHATVAVGARGPFVAWMVGEAASKPSVVGAWVVDEGATVVEGSRIDAAKPDVVATADGQVWMAYQTRDQAVRAVALADPAASLDGRPAGIEASPDLAVGPDGRVTMVWYDTDGRGTAFVRGRGGVPTVLAAFDHVVASAPDVAVSRGGAVVAAYTEQWLDASNVLVVEVFGATGRRGAWRYVPDDPQLTGRRPTVAVDHGSDVVVVFREMDDEGRGFGAAAVALSMDAQVRTPPTPLLQVEGTRVDRPVVAFWGPEAVLVAVERWQAGRSRIEVAVLDYPELTLSHGPVVVSEPGGQRPHVAVGRVGGDRVGAVTYETRDGAIREVSAIRIVQIEQR